MIRSRRVLLLLSVLVACAEEDDADPFVRYDPPPCDTPDIYVSVTAEGEPVDDVAVWWWSADGEERPCTEYDPGEFECKTEHEAIVTILAEHGAYEPATTGVETGAGCSEQYVVELELTPAGG